MTSGSKTAANALREKAIKNNPPALFFCKKTKRKRGLKEQGNPREIQVTHWK